MRVRIRARYYPSRSKNLENKWNAASAAIPATRRRRWQRRRRPGARGQWLRERHRSIEILSCSLGPYDARVTSMDRGSKKQQARQVASGLRETGRHTWVAMSRAARFISHQIILWPPLFRSLQDPSLSSRVYLPGIHFLQCNRIGTARLYVLCTFLSLFLSRR